MSQFVDFYKRQEQRNEALLRNAKYLGERVESKVLPFSIDLRGDGPLSEDELRVLTALEKESASVAISTLESLARINEVDHLGGGLELIPPLLLTMLLCESEGGQYTIEHAHTSIGYYSSLAALGYLQPQDVVEGFRRSLDIAGHVSWLPGGTQLSGGRLGVMVPVAVGQSLGLRVNQGRESFVICHCGDAGWLSGQALNGFLGASAHHAPIVFVMHRNGIQLSGTCKGIMDKDPRDMIAAAGVEILETTSLHETAALYDAYREAIGRARQGRPVMIYPTGYQDMKLSEFGDKYAVRGELEDFAGQQGVSLDTAVWVPGSLMSWRDPIAMIECVFYVNGLSGGRGHHDGHLKGRDAAEILSHGMLTLNADEQAALANLREQPPSVRVTTARPRAGHPNLVLNKDHLDGVELPPVGKSVSPRNGSQIGYATVAKAYPDEFFTISCDLDPSTKLDKAKTFVDADHKFEMGITEQASSLMASGLALSTMKPQLVVFATFGAFFDGIAREGMELWRYQRNLDGINEGVNVTMHLSHVGACTGRDHFSGWTLDWINMAIGYLPYLRRFYAPADARAAFVAVKDLAAGYGAHMIGIPRDNVPILDAPGGGPLWDQHSPWTPTTVYRKTGARKAILAFGCTAFLGLEACEMLAEEGISIDVIVVNGLPLPDSTIHEMIDSYPEGLVTIEDGIIGQPECGLRGFAGLIQTATLDSRVPCRHVGITDPRIAPSDGFRETWNHFGISAESLVQAVQTL